MPSKFTLPPFNSYDGKTNPVEHVSHYIHMMSLHTHNDPLMCKVFHSSLGPTALRWFNGLRKGFIHSFAKLIQEFDAQFITCSRVPQLMDALLSMKISVGETLHSYANWYWVGAFTTRLAGVTRRLQPALLGWGCPRIQSYRGH